MTLKNSSNTSKALLIAILCSLTTITFLAYYPALNNDFVKWDTWSYVIGNTHIQALTWDNISWMLTSVHNANWHPLTFLSHALDYYWFGLDPRGHHLTSVLFHCLNTSLVFILTIALLTADSSNSNASIGTTNKIYLAAFFTALLFGIHPQHVESVVWVAERKDVLFLFFVLLALISYVLYSATRITRTTYTWYFVTLIFFILALLSKPMAVTLPVILLLIDVYPLNRTGIRSLNKYKQLSYKLLLIEKIPFFVFSLASVIITITAQEGAISDIEDIAIYDRLLNAFNGIVFYISKFFLPLGLSPFYPHPSFDSYHEYSLSLVPVIAFFLISFFCGYMWLRKKYFWLIVWLFYLATLSPVLGIIQVGGQAAADRYTYLPTIPFYMLVGAGISHLIFMQHLERSYKAILATAFLLTTIGLSHLTYKQISVWKDDLTLWSHVVEHAPGSAIARFRLGTSHLEKGNYQQAIAQYHQAITLDPNIKWAINLPIAHIELGQLQEAQNILNGLILNHPNENEKGYFYHMAGRIHYKQGRFREAQQYLRNAIELDPGNKDIEHLLLKLSSQTNIPEQ